MKLYNTLSKKVEVFTPLNDRTVRIYSCGPTVYDHIHIGNLSAFIAADTMRRVLLASGLEVQHVMNFTDVDDKTIRRSAERHPDLNPEEALKKLTDEYKQIFLDDMVVIGNDTVAMKFVSAVDSMEGMRALIRDLHEDGFAYIADDGVYFSIEKYKASGKKYGQLLELTSGNTSESRIDNDEYDKESVHDFALWKTRKGNEPAWEFELAGKDMLGRPGWHIECSVMSVNNLGQPFDIHTGGVDLIFPHHENEIAQSTAGNGDMYAKYFVHNEHLLVDGKKMSKSLNNFFTLRDIQERGFVPLAFRLMMLQSHYRNQSNFTWDNLQAAQNRLNDLKAFADTLWQPLAKESKENRFMAKEKIQSSLENDINTPEAIALLSEVAKDVLDNSVHKDEIEDFKSFLEYLDTVFGLDLLTTDVSKEIKSIIEERRIARENKNFTESDVLRDKLKEQGIGIRDTSLGQVWYRL